MYQYLNFQIQILLIIYKNHADFFNEIESEQ